LIFLCTGNVRKLLFLYLVTTRIQKYEMLAQSIKISAKHAI